MGTVLFDNLLVLMSAKRKRRYSKCQDGPGVSYSGYFNQNLFLGTVPLFHFWAALTVHDCTITVTIRTVPVDTTVPHQEGLIGEKGLIVSEH